MEWTDVVSQVIIVYKLIYIATYWVLGRFLGPGLDHGVFIPFRIMFGNGYLDIPIVQVSIDASMSPEKNWQVGSAVSALR